jgi:hypothetical protein
MTIATRLNANKRLDENIRSKEGQVTLSVLDKIAIGGWDAHERKHDRSTRENIVGADDGGDAVTITDCKTIASTFLFRLLCGLFMFFKNTFSVLNTLSLFKL